MSTTMHSTTRIRSFVAGDVPGHRVAVGAVERSAVGVAPVLEVGGHRRAERAEQSAAWANARAARLRDERDAETRSVRAYRGHVTRLRNRIANGICPVQGCRRNFANVKAHIESQHPEWAHDHAEALT